MSNHIALIDGDTIAYMAGFAAQTRMYNIYEVLADGSHSPVPVEEFESASEANAWLEKNNKDGGYIRTATANVGNVSAALSACNKSLDRIIEELNVERYKVYLSDSYTFRHSVATIAPYKANRKVENKPYYLKAVKRHLISVWDAEIWDDLEADDAVSISSHRYDADGMVPIIVSIDKDLDQVPGIHYNFRTRERYVITPKQAIRNYYIQVLTGDSTDNIIGLKGIGPKKADKILGPATDSVEMAKCVYDEYMKRLGPEDGKKHLEEVCKLVYLLKNEQEKEDALKRIIQE